MTAGGTSAAVAKVAGEIESISDSEGDEEETEDDLFGVSILGKRPAAAAVSSRPRR